MVFFGKIYYKISQLLQYFWSTPKKCDWHPPFGCHHSQARLKGRAARGDLARGGETPKQQVPLFIALRIVLTLPVSVASGERSFSKLKLIKNYLKSSIFQERLIGLSLMSIEYDVLQKIDINTFIKDCGKKSS